MMKKTAHMIFEVGDQVKIYDLKGSNLPKDIIGKVGKVIIVMNNISCTKQWCRVQFSDNTFDYEDVGSWSLKRDDIRGI